MSWKSYRLGDILERKRLKVNVAANELYKLVTIKLWHKGIVLREHKKGQDIKSGMYRVNEGDFILSGIDARNGAFGIVPEELDNAIVTNDFWCLEPNKKLLRKDFFLFLTSTKFFDYICNQCSDGTTQRIRLQRDKFYDFKILLPPINQQKTLVKSLTQSNKSNEGLSAEITHQLDLVKQLRQAFLREAMQGKLVPQNPNDLTAGQAGEPASVLLEKIKAEKALLQAQGRLKKQKPLPPIREDEIPFEIPDNWVWCRLGEPIYYTDNIDIQNNLSPTTLINYVDIDAIDNQIYSIKEAKSKRVEELSSRARRVLRKGFIVYSTVRPYLKNIAIVEEELPNMIGSTGFNVFKPILLETKYLFYFLLNPDLNKEYERMMIGFNSPSITNVQFENTLLPLPPLSEQQRIVAKLDELMQYCDNLEASIKESQTQNDLLLQQVLREALEPTSNESSAGRPKGKEVEKI